MLDMQDMFPGPPVPMHSGMFMSNKQLCNAFLPCRSNMALIGGAPLSEWPGAIYVALNLGLVVLPGAALDWALLAASAAGTFAACCCLCGWPAGRRRRAESPPALERSPIKGVPGFPVPLLRKRHGA